MKKKILSESQVRRFMGLAGIQPINEMSYKKDEANESVYEEDLMEENYMEEDLMEQEPEEDEMKSDGSAADVEIDEEVLKRIKKNLDELQDDLAPLIDQAEMDAEEEPADDMSMDVEEEPADDMSMDDDDEEGDEGMDAELGDVDVEPTEDEKEQMQEEIVNEVARRVAKRIVEAKRAHKKMNEALGRKK